MDYTAGFILFLLTVLIATTLLVRTAFRENTFDAVRRSAESASQQLMGTGYPSSWRTDDVLSVGLLTDGRLSVRKAERLAALASEDYDRTRQLLNTPYQYAITFQERNGSLRQIAGGCRIGSTAATEQKTVNKEVIPIAYYTRSNGTQLLSSLLASLNATHYSDDELAGMLENLSDYRLVVLENPSLGGIASPYDAQKAQDLESYVADGGTLLLIGDPGLPELFDLNLTAVNGSGNSAASTGENDTLLNLSGLTVDDVDGSLLTAGDEQRYRTLDNVTPLLDHAATFVVGDGDVTFLGGLGGTINQTGESLLDHVSEQLNASAFVDVADCQSVEVPSASAQNLVAIRRLVADRGRILIMTLYVWEPQ